MSHIRKPLGLALALNTAVFVLEMAGGLRAHSLSLLMDGVHNLSDELALVCLFLAYRMAVRLSRGLQRVANVLNSVGLAVISGLVAWQAVERVVHPLPVTRWLPIVVGLLAAAGNREVARVLRQWEGYNAAIRLAYLHNLGDAYVSLAPVAAGLLVSFLHRPWFDPLVAILVGVWILGSTVFELRRSVDCLIWPEQAVCPHEPTTA